MDKISLRSIVVDDEPAFVDNLVAMLKSENPGVSIVGKAGDLEGGLTLIRELQPELVFLDIRLGNESGFELLRLCPERNFQVIFITAYDSYAVEAFKFSAIDFLLKPVASHDLYSAIKRAQEMQHQHQTERQLGALLENIQNIGLQNHKLVLRESEALHIVILSDILWCSAEGSYTTFHLAHGGKITVSQHLKEYENLLESRDFFRIHRSTLVNLHKIRRVDKVDHCQVQLNDGSKLAVSVRKKEHLVHRLSTLY